MLVAFHLHRRPLSVNAKLSRGYMEQIATQARRSYSGPPSTQALYSRIIWFHKKPSTGDVDNIAKRIHDALKGVVFLDDGSITHTMAVRVNASVPVELIANPDSPDGAEALADSLGDESVHDILYRDRKTDRSEDLPGAACMTTRPDYLRYLESATQAEFEDRLRSEGYSIQTEEFHGDVRFDLVARKGPKSIAYEFKAGRSPKSGRESIERLQRAAKEAGFEFHIVVVNPPPRVNVEIDNLASQLHEYMMDSIPDELDSLSTHTSVSGVCDLNISDIRVGKGEIRVAGAGTVDVDLQYGSKSDEGAVSGDAFPFHFKAVLSADGELSQVEELKVDTSSFYE